MFFFHRCLKSLICGKPKIISIFYINIKGVTITNCGHQEPLSIDDYKFPVGNFTGLCFALSWIQALHSNKLQSEQI